MEASQALNRRRFFSSGAAFGIHAAASPKPNRQAVFRFATQQCEVLMTVEFFDRYSSRGFSFDETLSSRLFCLAANGQEDRNCLKNFCGALAVARYRIQPRFNAPQLLAIRETVRTIDQDSRLTTRPPFERAIQLQDGMASDIQAFGAQTETASDAGEPWCLLRQDLYLDREDSSFLIVHWKHALNEIRLVDVIPGKHVKSLDA
jgi:hypothetical protein